MNKKTDINLELESVRQEASNFGIKFHHRAGVDKIQKLIDEHTDRMIMGEGLEEAEHDAPELEALVEAAERTPQQEAWLAKTVIPKTEKQWKNEQRRSKRQQAAALVRCIITNTNPEKQSWPGEIVSVGSAKLGTFKKFVPFNTGKPYHLPRIIFDMLKERKCSHFYTEKNRLGHEVKKSRLVNEYTLAELPRLTPEEIDELSRKQKLAEGQGF